MANFDYIVVGAGTSGSVVAGRLSESGQCNICVLEAGPPDNNLFIHIPAAVVYTLGNQKINWMYNTEACSGTAGRSIVQSRGKTLGGSGSINGHIYTRGHRFDFDNWAKHGNNGWAYADVLPYFKRSENCIGIGSDQFRGRTGPFTITGIDEPDALCDAFIEGAKSLGIPCNPDYNGALQDGINYVQRSIYNGRRVSPARAFLHPAVKRGNVDLRCSAQVTNIIFKGKRAIGVRYRQAGIDKTIYANSEVIVCAGTIASPQLLQISGIGDPQLLNQLSVPVIHALPGVGENLCDHYAARLVSRVTGLETINERVRGIKFLKELMRYVFTQRGVLALTPTLVYCFWKSENSLDHGDIQVSFTPASYPQGIWAGLDKFPGATIACWQQRPRSKGYVRARCADSHQPPEIQANYLADPEDQRLIIAAMRLGRKLMLSKAIAPYIESEIWPGNSVQSDSELLAHARQTGNTTYHPIGSCQMGSSRRIGTVVDNQLRVHGVTGLRVADASIIPSMPAANINASALMIGEKAADLILGKKPLSAEKI